MNEEASRTNRKLRHHGHGPWTKLRTELELERVHRRELARLLRQAARSLAGLGAGAYACLLPPLLATWRRRVRRQLDVLARDGWYFEGQELLAGLLAGRRPDPELLMAVSLDLWASPGGLLALGQVLLGGGRPAEAQAVYAEAMRFGADEGIGGEFPWRVREGLAASWEALGKDRLALGCLRAAVDFEGVGAGPLAGGLFLAFEVGDTSGAAELRGRIDARFQPGSRRLLACADSLAHRRRLLRPGAWAPALGVARLFTEVHGGDSAAAVLCRSFVSVGGRA
ncbi:MAG: hypothetical protein P1V81_10405 [Planctomycetota bacterium]|nr:hypothetical protein [Planctomycetota bacterium]